MIFFLAFVLFFVLFFFLIIQSQAAFVNCLYVARFTIVHSKRQIKFPLYYLWVFRAVTLLLPNVSMRSIISQRFHSITFPIPGQNVNWNIVLDIFNDYIVVRILHETNEQAKFYPVCIKHVVTVYRLDLKKTVSMLVCFFTFLDIVWTCLTN